MKSLKKIIVILTISMFTVHLEAQVGIGTSDPNISSILDITSNNKGVLIPRVSLNSSNDQTTIPSPATGLMVFNTGDGSLSFKGFVFWNGFEWRSINSTSTVNPIIGNFLCNNASVFPSTFTSGVPYSGTLTVPYSGGNGGSYQSSTSYTQNGLTFTLIPGTLNQGNGAVAYSVTGTPNFSSPNSVSVPLAFLDKNCSVIIGNTDNSFLVGEVKSNIVVIPVSQFSNRSMAVAENVMTGKNVSNVITYNNRTTAYNLASALDKAKFIRLKGGFRLDFMQSTGSQFSVSPKIFNESSVAVLFDIASLSTNDSYITGGSTTIAPGYYAFRVDGNDDFNLVSIGGAEYVNVMLSFPDGEWYNCTWYTNRDNDNYYFYTTAQRLN